MRLVLQRVSTATVRVGERTVGSIGHGVLVLCGVEKGDGSEQVRAAARKLKGLRIFDDASGHMNLDPRQVGAAFLVVSQFTLAGSLAKGRRPSFDGAASGEIAEPLVEELSRLLREAGFEVACGRFGARMEVELVNDGPVTFVLQA